LLLTLNEADDPGWEHDRFDELPFEYAGEQSRS
jgi:hypothetical protein